MVSRLTEQTSRLVRDELMLAKAEMTESAKHGGIGAGMFGASGLVALYGLAAIIAGAIAALALVLPVWASALIIGAVLLLVAGIVALMGKKQAQQVKATPETTIESIKRDVDEVKEHSHHDNAR